VELAEEHGIHLMLSLTNNWNPRPLLDNIDDGSGVIARRDVTSGTGNELPRNVLSNDYGGMDVYVRQWGSDLHHDEFYVNDKILQMFKNYTTQVITRYINSPAIFSWEIANDPRCNSSIPSRAGCTTQTVTKWTATMSDHVRSVDPNHLVSSGNAGFYCLDCEKLFPLVSPPPPPPAPKVSPAPGFRRRKAESLSPKESLLVGWAADRKRKRELKKRSSRELQRPANLARTPIRGRWKSTASRRQATSLGPAFDGSHGVDTEDILNIPGIGFNTFQLFPDQNRYAPVVSDVAGLDHFNASVQIGLDWIQRHIETARKFGKPLALTSFGLVTVDNGAAFVPFNKTVSPFNKTSSPTPPVRAPNQGGSNGQQPFLVTNDQRDNAYERWLKTGVQGGINGMIHYQWSQSNLTGHAGTTVSSASDGNTVSPNQMETGVSPNDGYSIEGTGKDSVQGVLGSASQQIAAD
jgi:mannan endo-1,4-beta-mannosidase